eukprot:6487020-Amphidinium_carterae.1
MKFLCADHHIQKFFPARSSCGLARQAAAVGTAEVHLEFRRTKVKSHAKQHAGFGIHGLCVASCAAFVTALHRL